MRIAALRRGAIAIGTVLACGSGTAVASGFALLEQSASRLGTAFAGTAAIADDATTIFYNPAGMTKLAQPEAALVFTGVDISSQFDTRNSLPALGQQLGSEGGDAGGWNAVPAAYLAVPINSRFAAGLGINAPFGLKLGYDSNWIGRFQALRSKIETLNVNPAVSMRLNERVTLGVGLDYQRIQAELTNALNYTAVIAQGVQQLAVAGQLPPAAVPGLIAANAGLEGGTDVRSNDTAWGYNAGVLVELSPSTRIGLAYRSPIKYEMQGSVRFVTPTVFDPTGAAIVAGAGAGPLANGGVSIDLKLPDIATASLYQSFGRLEVMADIAWTGWSSLQELRIVRDSGSVLSVTPEKFEDTWRYALGATYALSDAWTLRAGVAFDETPVPDETRTPRLPDAQRKWVAVGTRWSPGGKWSIDAGYAHLFSSDVPLDQDGGNVSSNGLLNGQQASDVNIVSMQVRYRW